MNITRNHTRARMSQAVIHGNTIYLAGQVASDSSANISVQTEQVLEIIDQLLADPEVELHLVTHRAATEKRPVSSAEPRMGNPLPSSPNRPSSGTKASSKWTSARLSRLRVRMGKSLSVMPGVLCGSTRKAVTPLCRLLRSMLATTKKSPACSACEMNTLVPFSR